MRDELSRRAVVVGGLTGLAACGSTAGKSSLFRGNDRPIVEGPGTFGRNISCDNDTILQSALDGRLSQFADFADLGTCKLTPDSFEGPYFTCVKPRGKDITDGRAGQPLAVAIQVTDDDCNPIENAIVDIWACDAEGNYSAFTASPDEFATSGTNVPPETDERFCRGVMKTDKDGIVEFDTLYPGYYAGRAIHIHYKVHIGNKAYITNQALFPEKANSAVLEQSPYNKPRGTRRVLNAEEADAEFDLFDVRERDERLLALLRVSSAFG